MARFLAAEHEVKRHDDTGEYRALSRHSRAKKITPREHKVSLLDRIKNAQTKDELFALRDEVIPASHDKMSTSIRRRILAAMLESSTRLGLQQKSTFTEKKG